MREGEEGLRDKGKGENSPRINFYSVFFPRPTKFCAFSAAAAGAARSER